MKCDWRARDNTVLLLSLATLFLLQGARELMGTTYNFNLSTMSINISVLAVLAFLAPAMLVFLTAVESRKLLWTSGTVAAASRIILSLGAGPELHLASAFLVVSGMMVFLTLLWKSVLHDVSAIWLALALAACADIFLKALGGSFDMSVYGLWGIRPLSLLLTAPLVIFFILALRQAETTTHPVRPSPLFGIVLGLGGFIYMTFSGFPNVMAAWTGAPPVLTYAVSILSLAGLALLFSHRPDLADNQMAFLGSQALLAVGFLALYASPRSALSQILLPASILPLAIILRHSMEATASGRRASTEISLLVGGLVFIVLALVSVMTLTWAHVPGTGFLKDRMPLIALAAPLLLIVITRIIGGKPTALQKPGEPDKAIAVLCIVLLIMTGAVPAMDAAAPTARPAGLRVMTYNIHQGYGMDGMLDPWDILEPIEDADPDILILQESETNRISGMNTDMLNWLAAKLRMSVYSGPTAGEQIYGIALLSKYPILDSRLYYLDSIEDQRVWFRCLIDTGREQLAVHGIHVGLSPEDRTSQTNQVIERLQNETAPFILAGDFNTWPNETIYSNLTSIMHDAWTLAGHDANGPGTYTFDSPSPSERIDYIFVSDQLAPRLLSCRVMEGYEGSDHLPVWAEFSTD